MNILKKIILFIKNIFTKHDTLPKLIESSNSLNQNRKLDFIQSLKVTTTKKNQKKKIETLTCEGDGLGIQKKISF